MNALGTLGGLLVMLIVFLGLAVIWLLGWAIGSACGLLLPEGEDEIGE